MDRSPTRGEYPFDRLVAGLEETRLDLGLSRANVARFAGLSTGMVARLERSQCRNFYAGVRLRTALTMLELSAPPKERELVEGLVTRIAIRESS